MPRPITEPGKGNYWTYDPNPAQKTSRRPKRSKRKPDREDDYGGRDDYDDGRQPKLPRHYSPPPLTSDGRFTPSSSDTGDPSRSGQTVNRDRGIAFVLDLVYGDRQNGSISYRSHRIPSYLQRGYLSKPCAIQIDRD